MLEKDLQDHRLQPLTDHHPDNSTMDGTECHIQSSQEQLQGGWLLHPSGTSSQCSATLPMEEFFLKKDVHKIAAGYPHNTRQSCINSFEIYSASGFIHSILCSAASLK